MKKICKFVELLFTDMTSICLYVFPVLQTVDKSGLMAQRDPHGFIMSITAVAVVFSSLIILYLCYSLIGKFLSGQIRMPDIKMFFRKKDSTGQDEMTDETAAAIAMALQEENSDEVYAAIAMALHSYSSDQVHDTESYVITIRPSQAGTSDRSRWFRKAPVRK